MKYFTPTKLSENIAETPEGFLVCIGVPIARTGEMVYGEGETPLDSKNGKVLIQRDEKEVFSPKTIASFEGKAVTITHPTAFVGPDNWSQLAKGVLQNVRRGEGDQKDDLIADLLITDASAIFLVKNGLREVSCGYEADYTQTDEGRGIQTNIIGNHLALVEQGRAGSSYAINDHKGKGTTMGLKDKIKAIFAKAQDEAMKMAEDEGFGGKKEEKKDEPAKDAYGQGMDELVKICKDLGEKVDGLASKMAPKDEKKPEEKEEPAKDAPKEDDRPFEQKKDDSKDEGGMEASLEDRLKKIEACLPKIMEALSMSADEDIQEGEGEAEDDDFDETTMTGDTASRAEILAPGIKLTKDVKKNALQAAYKTKEGQKVIDALTGGKPAFDSAEKVETLFVAASELLKVSRNKELSKTKDAQDVTTVAPSSGAVTAEKLNEINAKFWASKNN